MTEALRRARAELLLGVRAELQGDLSLPVRLVDAAQERRRNYLIEAIVAGPSASDELGRPLTVEESNWLRRWRPTRKGNFMVTGYLLNPATRHVVSMRSVVFVSTDSNYYGMVMFVPAESEQPLARYKGKRFSTKSEAMLHLMEAIKTSRLEYMENRPASLGNVLLDAIEESGEAVAKPIAQERGRGLELD